MAERDQAARQQVFSTGSEVDSIAVINMLAVDAANQDSLLHIIEAHGWPRKAQVGRRGLGAALLILQHADHPFQKRMLPDVRASFELGEVKCEQLALLTDRVLVGDGGAQRYGTQAEIVDGKVQFFPIEDEARVDDRRAQLGLMPLARYQERLQKMLGVED